MKTVSVIIPTYQRPELVVRAVQSVLNTDYHNLEIIVVDDNFPDNHFRKNTRENLLSLQASQLTILETPGHCGPAFARNMGLNHANGEWIAFLDDDDEWLTEKLNVQVQVLEEGYHACITAAINVFNNAEKISFPKKRKFIKDVDFYRGGSLGGQISSLIYKKSSAPELRFIPDLQVAEENIFMYMLHKKAGPLYYIDRPLVRIYRNTGNLSSINKNKDFLNEKSFKTYQTLRKPLGKYYSLLLARIIVGANLSPGELNIRKVLLALKHCGIWAVLRMIFYKARNFILRKFYPTYY